MLKNTKIAAVVIGLSFLLSTAVYAQNYIRPLVKNLLAIGYPISAADVVALDKISMHFNTRNRIDVLKQILSDRQKIHGIKKAGYFEKTEVICSALRLLDEHNLPETDALIGELSRQGGWEKREKELLSYMAAKRKIEYSSNVAYLLTALAEYSGNSELSSKVEISAEILDLCNCLSYLSGIFNHTGDLRIINDLFRFASQAFGYPGEYVSRLLVDMFLQQPKIFVSNLAAKDEQTKNTIIDLMVFGIWNSQLKENVMEAIHDNLVLKGDSEKHAISLLIKKINLRFAPNPTNGNK
ncbi:MAG: hypothetical protein GXP53_03385 [Deltaproteobacteria bacterium]|nr:hypothetical protein [Deltaproteobacteria bacterium]